MVSHQFLYGDDVVVCLGECASVQMSAFLVMKPAKHQHIFDFIFNAHARKVSSKIIFMAINLIAGFLLYRDIFGVVRSVYSWRLTRADPQPKEKNGASHLEIWNSKSKRMLTMELTYSNRNG